MKKMAGDHWLLYHPATRKNTKHSKVLYSIPGHVLALLTKAVVQRQTLDIAVHVPVLLAWPFACNVGISRGKRSPWQSSVFSKLAS
jgi:hypothetical protein